MKIKERELHVANIEFVPALCLKTKGARQVFLRAPSSFLYHCGYAKRDRIYIRKVVSLCNIPESDHREMVLSETTTKILRKQIQERIAFANC